MVKTLVISLLSITLLGCQSDGDDALPNTQFASSYQLSDFNLNDSYNYWEVRRGNMQHQAEEADEVMVRFNDEIHASLTTEQRELLANADTNNGYDAQCLPSYCPIYGVALLNDNAVVIESKSDLLEFFGDIDTEAELAHLLSIGYSTPKFFQKNDLGYKAILGWDSLCGQRGENLIQVDFDGTITIIKELSTEEYNSCV